jgi:hypothetical protein
VLVDILGVCSVLETSAHRGYAERFVRYTDRAIPGKRFVEHVYPRLLVDGRRRREPRAVEAVDTNEPLEPTSVPIACEDERPHPAIPRDLQAV